jgi:uncharacterized repeat protein (TIGR02543 family)
MKLTKGKATLIFAIVSLTAVFILSACEVKTYSVIFINDGVVYETVNVKNGKTVNLPNEPAKDGYIFGGWAYSDNTNAIFDGSEKITANVVLTAKWSLYTPQLLFTPITGGYKVSVGTAANATDIIIPQEYNEKPVLVIDDSFKDCKKLVKLTIPFVGETLDGTSNTQFGYIFGVSAYTYLNYAPASLKEVIVTGGTSVWDYAFAYCISLTSITLPNSVTSIGSYAFDDCSRLTSITIPSSVTRNSFMGINLK